MVATVDLESPLGLPYADATLFLWPDKKRFWMPTGFVLFPASDLATDGFGTPFYNITDTGVEKKPDVWGTYDGGFGSLLLNRYENNRYTYHRTGDPDTDNKYGLEEEKSGTWYIHHPQEVPLTGINLDLWRKTNELRVDEGLEPYVFPLRESMNHVRMILDQVSYSGKHFHDHPAFKEHYRLFNDRVTKDGIGSAAENLAFGDVDYLESLGDSEVADYIFQAWVDSPGHYANLLRFTDDVDKKKAWLGVGGYKRATIEEDADEGVYDPVRDAYVFGQVMKNPNQWVTQYPIDWRGEVLDQAVSLSWFGNARYDRVEVLTPNLTICGRDFYGPSGFVTIGACVREMEEEGVRKAYVYCFSLALEIVDGELVADGDIDVHRTEYPFAKVTVRDGAESIKHFVQPFSNQDLDWAHVTTLNIRPAGVEAFRHIPGHVLFSSNGAEGVVANFGPFVQSTAKDTPPTLQYAFVKDASVYTSQTEMDNLVHDFPMPTAPAGDANWEYPSYSHPYFFKITIDIAGTVAVEEILNAPVTGTADLTYDAKGDRIHPRNENCIYWGDPPPVIDPDEQYAVTNYENTCDGQYIYAIDYRGEEQVRAMMVVSKRELKEYWYAPEILSVGSVGSYFDDPDDYHENRILKYDITVRNTLTFTDLLGQEQTLDVLNIDEIVEIDELRRFWIDQERDAAEEFGMLTESREYVEVDLEGDARESVSVVRYLSNFDLRTGHLAYMEATRTRGALHNVWGETYEKATLDATLPAHYQVRPCAYTETPPDAPVPIAGSEKIICAEPAHYTGFSNPDTPDGRLFVHYLDYPITGVYRFVANGEEAYVTESLSEDRERLASPFGSEFLLEMRGTDLAAKAERFFDSSNPFRVWLDDGTYHHPWSYPLGYGDEAIKETDSYYAVVFRFSDCLVGDYNMSCYDLAGPNKHTGLEEHTAFRASINMIPTLYRDAWWSIDGDVQYTNELDTLDSYRYPIFSTAEYGGILIASVDFDEFWGTENGGSRYTVYSNDTEVQALLDSIPGEGKRLYYLKEM